MGAVIRQYVSEHTRWINAQLEEHPEWVESQRVGRALWWDKPPAAGSDGQQAGATVPAKAYPYDVNF